MSLSQACQEGNIDAVNAALQDPDINKALESKDGDGRTPLHWAVSGDHREIVAILLQAGAKSCSDESGWTPFHIACAVGDLDIVKRLWESHELPDPDVATNNGTTPLHLAVSKRHTGVVQFLLEECGASTNVRDSRGQLPLHRAAAGNLGSLVALLCEHGSPVDKQDSAGWTPLFHALAEGHTELAIVLVKTYGADYTIENNQGECATDVALNDEVKRYFLRNVSH